MARLDRAEKVDPTYDAAHFYRGAGAARRARPSGAGRGRLKWYLAHGPASTLVAAAQAALAQAEAKG